MRQKFVICGLLFFASPLLAAPTSGPRDVPQGHWAAGAVHRVMAQGLMQAEPSGKFDGNKPVTRYELAVVLDRLVRAMEQARKPLSAAPPQTVTLPPEMPAAPAAALRHLVGSGFLPASTPLVRPPGTQPVTAAQLADALADVTIRLSDRALPPTQH